MNIRQVKDYYNTKPVEFVTKQSYKLFENIDTIPRFTIKNATEIANIPINSPVKPTQELITKAIKFGLIFLISYKGAQDKHFAGHERVIYPMVIGRSAKGNILVRGYHLKGWSVSNNRHTDKIWRMFRLDRVLSITFTGSFYRLPPSGYNMEDRGMRGGIISRADFNEIRRNQQNLIQAQKIQNKEEITLGGEKTNYSTVKITNTNTILDLRKPKDNPYIKNLENNKDIRITFLKSSIGNEYVALLGALGQPGNIVKMSEKGKQLGIFTVLDSISGQSLFKIKKYTGPPIFKLFIFESKV